MADLDSIVLVLQELARWIQDDCLQVVLVSMQTEAVTFLAWTDDPGFRDMLERLVLSGAVPLGVVESGHHANHLKGSRMLFPWLKGNDGAVKLFEAVCGGAAKAAVTGAKSWERFQ